MDIAINDARNVDVGPTRPARFTDEQVLAQVDALLADLIVQKATLLGDLQVRCAESERDRWNRGGNAHCAGAIQQLAERISTLDAQLKYLTCAQAGLAQSAPTAESLVALGERAHA